MHVDRQKNEVFRWRITNVRSSQTDTQTNATANISALQWRMVTSKVALWAKADSKSMLVGEAGARGVALVPGSATCCCVQSLHGQLPVVTIATTAVANLGLWAAGNGSIEFRLAVASVCRVVYCCTTTVNIKPCTVAFYHGQASITITTTSSVTAEIVRVGGHYAVQGHSRSLISILIEAACATS